MKDNDTPYVTVMVPTTRSRVKFIPLVTRNITSQTFPHDRIEVLVIGDQDPYTKKEYQQVSSLLSKTSFRYVTCDIKDNIGKKRNFGCSKATHDIIAMMDDDDIYSSQYIEHCVSELMRRNKAIVGCRDMIITWPSIHFETRYVRGSHIHEGTMVFLKKHWELNGFKESSSGEGVPMVTGSFYNEIDIRKVMICVAHESNTFDKTALLRSGMRLELKNEGKESLREVLSVLRILPSFPRKETS